MYIINEDSIFGQNGLYIQSKKKANRNIKKTGRIKLGTILIFI